MREIYIKSSVGLLDIGRRGENLVTRVHLPEVPESGQAVTVYVLRNGDTAAYPASNVEITDTEIIWTVTSVDTGKSGRGKVQYKFADATTGEVIKTEIFGFLVGLAIDTEVGPAPDPYESWLDSLTDLADETQINAREAESAAESASASAEAASASAESASGSASQASDKAAEASGSATTASQKASEASSSASSAAGSATAASWSASAASTSASQAAASAEAASASATSAGQSKDTAQTAAQTATTKASEASASATSAASSASTATTKAGEASQSATSAASSASTASTKASEASASATSASGSASTATTKASEASASATAAQEARTGAESAAQTAQAGADAVGLLREQIYNSYPNVEAEEGPIVSISDGADGIPVKSLVVGIEPMQAGSGDPSPDNVRLITGWTGATVRGAGKNLLPPNPYSVITNNGITFVNNNGKYTVDGTSTARANCDIPINLPAGLYTFSGFNELGTVMNLYLMTSSNGRVVENIAMQSNNTVRTFTLLEPVSIVRFTIARGLTVVNGTANLEIVSGSTAPTEWEPYQGTTYPISFPSEAGTVYGGTLDVTNGVLTVDRAQIASYAGETLPGEWISDRDVYAAGTSPTTGAQVVYKLSTPITYQLTPTEVKTLLGPNSIWADTGDVSLAYRADPKLYIDGVYEDYQDDLADYADALAALG